MAALHRRSASRVLVVDDDARIRALLRLYLERDGHRVVEADDGPGALRAMREQACDLVLLDVMLPGLDGFEVCRQLREETDAAIVLLTARGGDPDKVVGLDLGADDYVVKPFSPRELVARVEAVLRRSGESAAPSVAFDGGAMVINRDAREVRLRGDLVELTRSEFDLLHALAAHPGRVFSRFELITKVQGYDYEGYERTIDAHVKNLRRKLGEDPRHPRYVLTVTGVGYKFGVKPDA
jgi:DNA-binding response OmpR family regulator